VDLNATSHLDVCLQLLEKLFRCGYGLRGAISESVRPAGLSETEFRLLWLCGRADPPGVHQTELSERLAVSPAQVSAMVEQLRRKKLLLGQRSRSDRRRQCWRVTPQGRALIASLAAELNPWAQRWLGHLSAGQLQSVAAALDSITTADRTNDALRIERGAA
jgi:DNA-binding MarR family transcriptional regulator